ncbi:MAG: DUF3418 domain-containing protein [Rhodanobacter sp.]
MLVMVAFLSVQDPRERPAEARAQADAAHKLFADPASDFAGVLNLWRAYRAAHEDLTQSTLRDWCSRHFLSFMRMREWSELHRQLLVVAQDLGWSIDAASPAPQPSAMKETTGLGRRAAKSSPRPGKTGKQGSTPERGAGTDTDASVQTYEALHRSVLSGLPTLVGRKDDRGAYQGPRERKFQVFPGSALAKSPPNWLCSAQILDVGGRVWAMTNARVDPLWIEQQAAHLLRTSCRDPHWSKSRGAVVAFEQVSLFGLVLVEKRPVLFQKQDPALAHLIFLREGLVRGDIATADHGRSSAASARRAGAAADYGRSSAASARDGMDAGGGAMHGAIAGRAGATAALLRANRRVLEQAEELEAKQRREGLIRHEDDLVAFFEGKLPPDIASVRAFDAWYRKATPTEQAALHWSLEDVVPGGSGPDAKAFPAVLEWEGQRYRLEYRFVPGDDADGVTLHVPLAMLNTLSPSRCEWLVPGLLADKVAELIRALPKNLRRNFVPAPDFARAFVAAEAPSDEPLHRALAAFLQRATGVVIGPVDFAGLDLPAHFHMRFQLHDEGEEPDSPQALGTSRDLAELRARWQGQARAAFARKTDLDLTRAQVTSWDFADIPARLMADGGLPAFPALVDMGETVALRVFERADEAGAAHRAGVARLLRNALAGDTRAACRRLPISNAMALNYAPLGTVDSLRNDLLEGGFADVLASQRLDVRSAEAFADLRAACQRKLFAAAIERLRLAESIIEAQADLKPWLRPVRPGFAKASHADLHEQLDALLAPGFLRELPLSRLVHLPRYLRAVRLRAERLRQDPASDQQRMLQVMPYWRAWLRQSAAGGDGAALDDLRWLIEEWRVSLFAQELKTAEPVSAKRLARALARVA